MKKGKSWLGSGLASTVGCPTATGAQREDPVEAPVRKLEEKPMLEQDVQASTALLVSGWQTRWEKRMVRCRPSCAVLQSWEGESCLD